MRMQAKSVLFWSRRVARVAGCLGIGFTLIGCQGRGPTSDDDLKAANQKKAAIVSKGPVAEVPAATDSGTVLHPIDSLPEGRRYRAAIKAIDRSELEVAERIRQELQADPQHRVLATAIKAMMLIKQNALEEAIGLAEEISAIPVMRAEAFVIAGEVYQRDNRLLDATAAFENAIDVEPQHARAHRWLGAIYYDTGAMQLAKIHLRKAAELEPTDVNSLLLSAKISQEYEQYEESARDYEQLLQRSPSPQIKVPIQIKLAECYLALRKLPQARQALVGCPPVPGLLAVQASIAESEGDSEAAINLAQEALRQAPENRTATVVLGRIYLSRRNWEAASSVLERLVKARPYDHEPRLLLGRALLGAGQKERGEQEVKAATKLKNTFLQFAELHQEAIKHPEDAQIRVELGQLAEELGKYELAHMWYRSALGLDPSNAGAQAAADRLANSRLDSEGGRKSTALQLQ